MQQGKARDESFLGVRYPIVAVAQGACPSQRLPLVFKNKPDPGVHDIFALEETRVLWQSAR